MLPPDSSLVQHTARDILSVGASNAASEDRGNTDDFRSGFGWRKGVWQSRAGACGVSYGAVTRGAPGALIRGVCGVGLALLTLLVEPLAVQGQAADAAQPTAPEEGGVDAGVPPYPDAGAGDAQSPASHGDAGDQGRAESEPSGTDSRPPSTAGRGAGESEALLPPSVVRSVPPLYPAGFEEQELHPTVVLKVTVLPDGRVSDVKVEHSAGEPVFDAAAVEAVRKWEFAPARRGGVPISSRVGVAVHFELPEFGSRGPLGDVPSAVGGEFATDETHVHPERVELPPEESDSHVAAFGARAEVDAPRRSHGRGAADFELDQEILSAAPRRGAGDLLAVAPGLVVARSEGEGVAHRIMLRGFDAEHGQDIELKVDGVPVNQPSHIHGQGYADLGFLIPETVDHLRVTEGVYDPTQGDFAVAGTAEFQLGVRERGLRFKSEYDSFGTFRQLALFAPPDQRADTFGAVVVRKTDGYGRNRAGLSGAVTAQIGVGNGPWHWHLGGSAYANRSGMAGVVRRDDVNAGRVGFYGVYPTATAQNQNGFAARAQLKLGGAYRGARGENAELGLWVVLSDFRLQENFTGFTRTSTQNPRWTGRGDLIEQTHTSKTVGLTARYRTAEARPFDFLHGFFELGTSARFDMIDQSQALLQAPQNQTWDRLVDASILGGDVGLWGDLDTYWGKRLSLRAGVRVNLLFYDVNDRLANFVPEFRRDDFLSGFRRSAAGFAAGPRLSSKLRLHRRISLLAAYGEGYRSPQARLLDDGEPAPFTKVRSVDGGFALTLDEADSLNVRASAYWTRVKEDVVFSPEEGRLERMGPTTRRGFVASLMSRPLPWLLTQASLTFVHATLDAPPFATAAQPNPAYQSGQLLPFVPRWVLRLDASATKDLFQVSAHPVRGQLGLGYSFWAERPLPFSLTSAPVSLLDVSASLAFHWFEVGVGAFNLIGRRYAASEFVFASQWQPGEVPSKLPARHVAAGAPRSVMAFVEVKL